MYTLYARRGTGSIGPQILLEEIGAPHRVEWVDREEAATPGYLKLNPSGKIPTLALDDGRPIFESAAIMIHLAQRHPDAGLAPPVGSSAHALFLQWMVFLAANVYEGYLRAYYPHRYTTAGEADAPKVKARALEDVVRHLGVVDAALSPYLLGAMPSAADYYLYMLSTWFVPSPKGLYDRLPRLKALAEAIAARPSVAKVMAMNA